MPSTARATYVVRWALGILFALGLVGFVAIPSFQGLVLRTVTGGFDQIRRMVAPTLEIETPVAVAATDQNDRKADFSNYGAHISVSAPGVGIMSTYWNGGYALWSGTSMSVPFVTGAAALSGRDATSR